MTDNLSAFPARRTPQAGRRRAVSALVALALSTGAAACSSDTAPPTTTRPDTPASSASGSTPAGATTWTAQASSGGSATVNAPETGRSVVSDLGGQQLELTGTGGGADRTWTRNGEAGKQVGRWEIKEPDKFKLKSPQGQTIWKVKTDSGKFKILKGEEEVVYEIRAKDGGAEVRTANAQVLGTVVPGAGGATVRSPGGGVLFNVTGPYSPGYGVLLCADIPLAERMVLFAELPTALGR